MKLSQKQKVYLKSLYSDKFLPLYKNGYFWNKNNPIFSNSKVLDCLGEEKDYVFILLNILKEAIDSELKKDFTVAILGAGSGSLGYEIRKNFNLSNLIELDINDKVINRLKKLYKHDLKRKFICADICNLPFSDNSIDCVVVYSTLRYIQDKQRAIGEIHRVLKKNGRAIVAEGRANSVIKNIFDIVINKADLYQLKNFKNIQLPNLTFFYYLLESLKTDSELKQILKSMSDEDGDFIKKIYKLAGSKKGTIHVVNWRKS